MVTISFWALGYGSVTATVSGGPSDEELTTATAAIALSLVLVPLAFALAAIISRRRDWPIALLIAMGTSLAVGLPLLVFGDPLGSLIAGYSAGAVSSLSRPENTTWRPRAVIAAGVTVLVLLADRFFPVVSLVFAPALPFTSMALVDALTRSRDADAT